MSNNPDKILQRIQIFLEKYRNNGFDFSGHHRPIDRDILDDLATAVHEFEVAEHEHQKPPIDPDLARMMNIKEIRVNLRNKINELDRLITLADFHGLLPDNTLRQELKKCHEEKSKLEKLDGISKNLITKLTEEKADLQKIIDSHYDRYEILKEIDKKNKNSEDSEVIRG